MGYAARLCVLATQTGRGRKENPATRAGSCPGCAKELVQFAATREAETGEAETEQRERGWLRD